MLEPGGSRGQKGQSSVRGLMLASNEKRILTQPRVLIKLARTQVGMSAGTGISRRARQVGDSCRD